MFSLPPPPLDDADAAGPAGADKMPMAMLISRIGAERGSFLNITEDSLRAEIDRDGDDAMVDVDSPASAPEDARDAGPEAAFLTSRDELIRLISLAHNKVAIALDFISLLISSLRPAAGTTSMSPHLKAIVPVGSLGADRIRPSATPSTTAAAGSDDQLIAAGWKREAIGNASRTLVAAQSGLTEELARERRYWDEICAVASLGTKEVVVKVRTPEYRGLGVRYGFGDAGSNYREKGLGIFKRRADGSVVLKIEGDRRTHVVAVEVWRAGARTGAFATQVTAAAPAPVAPSGTQDEVQREIKLARELLFDEELFYEMVRETRTVADLGVTLDPDMTIAAPLGDALRLVVRTVPYADPPPPAGADDVLAEAVSAALHLELSHTHRSNLALRTVMPAPLGAPSQKTATQPALLKPLLEHVDRADVAASLTTYLAELVAGSHAGLA
ncbi:mediator complex, subunit Med17 [Dipodascopsis tothii]|uniref:mediator complex, subunit Med17 n=1 Tax=Dipodascopsis tothii TaxID=44089 RepID=UPI0034CF6553